MERKQAQGGIIRSGKGSSQGCVAGAWLCVRECHVEVAMRRAFSGPPALGWRCL
jgi:hypothetical protein